MSEVLCAFTTGDIKHYPVLGNQKPLICGSGFGNRSINSPGDPDSLESCERFCRRAVDRVTNQK